MDAMLLLKASLVLAATLLATRLLGRATAAARHHLWTVAFAAIIALPLLTLALPGVPVPIPTAFDRVRTPPGQDSLVITTMSHDQRAAGATTENLEVIPPAPLRPAQVTSFEVTAPAILLTLWLGGTFLAATSLLISLLRARRLASDAKEISSDAWRQSADVLSAQLGLRRPARLLVSSQVSTPMAGGLRHPVVFLPASAAEWNVERRDVVLAHELAHLADGDPLRHVVARLAVAVYWFHPLAWIAARQATAAREQACDEAVLALGTRPSVYARVLLDLAESMHPPAMAVGALPMVDRSLLETRLMAILNDNVRPATARLGYLPVIGVMLLTLSLAAAQPAFVTSAMPNIGPAHTAIEGAAAVPANVPAIAQAEIDRNSACWWDTLDGRSFHGNISSSNSGGRTVIYEQVGTRGGDRIIQKSFGDLRLCMLAEGAADRSMTDRPSQWLSSAGRVVLEARRGNQVQRLEVTRQGQQRTWQVNGRDRAFDQAAQAWRDRMLTVLDTTWELSSLRGEVSSLRGQISSIRGEESSLRGHISSLGGQVSSLRGQISSIRGEESSLRGEISAIRGHLSSLDGEISSQRGAISSLYGSRSGASQIERDALAARIAQYEAEIKRIEQAIREYDAAAKVAAVEREIQARDVDAKTAAIEAEIRAFNVEGKVAEVERRIAALDVDGKVAAIERQISSLDAERRVRQLEDRREAELRQLEAAITALK